jgi:hypothetical protein
MRFYVYAFVLLAALLGTSATAAETPELAVAAIQKAVDTHDPVLLEKYIDLHGVIARGVDTFVRDYATHPPAGDGDPLLEMLAAGLNNQSSPEASRSMKLLLVEETRKFVLRGVASGDFSGRPSGRTDLPDGGIFAVLFADASTARKELRSVRVQPPKGDRTSATAKVYDFGSQRAYPVQLGLARQPQGLWKVTDVGNMAELIRMVRNESGAR